MYFLVTAAMRHSTPRSDQVSFDDDAQNFHRADSFSFVGWLVPCPLMTHKSWYLYAFARIHKEGTVQSRRLPQPIFCYLFVLSLLEFVHGYSTRTSLRDQWNGVQHLASGWPFIGHSRRGSPYFSVVQIFTRWVVGRCRSVPVANISCARLPHQLFSRTEWLFQNFMLRALNAASRQCAVTEFGDTLKTRGCIGSSIRIRRRHLPSCLRSSLPAERA